MRSASVLLSGLVIGSLLATGQPDVRRTPEVTGHLDAGAPSARYIANERAAQHGHPELVGRHLLAFDPGGRGLVTEVFGDLVEADRIVVVVPGSDVDLAHFAVESMAQAVYDEATWQLPGGRVAVIAWAGYRTPVGIGMDAARSELAQAGAERLLGLLSGLAPYVDARCTLLCHSYGSVVCARAAPRLDATGVVVSDIVALGSPGMDVSSVAEMGTPARIWAARSASDWIRWVPNVRVFGVGHGRDPTDPEFGARLVSVDDAEGHDGYLVPGTNSLQRVTAITLALDDVRPQPAGSR